MILFLVGAALFVGGAGMRIYASAMMSATERRLIAARPASPADVETQHGSKFVPADGPPTEIHLPSLGLWNTLEPVNQTVSWHDGQMAWDVADAGWHVASGWPGWGGNVVMAGHSPSRDRQTWSRSVFRQLAYLSPGDRIEVIAGSRHFFYAVGRVFAIPEREADTPEAAAWIERGESERLTLITCWPPQSAAYRVVVVAQPTGEKS
jgi:LPXTG-site transpeptidase (sortase) family protein